MSTDKKKGDFNGASGRSDDIGGNKKAHMKPDQNSRTAHKQTAGSTGGANVGKDN
jgi:hypothetical protein